MADIESNIRVNIDTANALANIKALQREISAFQSSMSRGSAAQANVARKLEGDLVNSINATQNFSARIQKVASTTESFTNALEKNKLSLGQYFRFTAASTKAFGSKFQNELKTIDKVARERVKDLQTQYIKLGRDATGAIRSIAVRPLVLDMEDLGTKTAIAAQKQQLFNQLMKQGSTNLLNFGKNTQWAGRQLMVGFTIPLTIFGTQAAKSFMQLEEQVIKFKKVYGDLFTSDEDREKALANINAIADGFTQYGVAIADTIALAAEAAAAGFGGKDLEAQTKQAVKLSVLGQLEQQKALETTISLQNAFRLSSESLAEAIDFLNAVENQTVVSLDDVTTAIPKVAPVIQSLGGDVKDLAFFLSAMKEGGVNASEGANALKSGLASLINPTEKSSEMLAQMGINIRGIVESNKGDLRGTVIGFAQALDKLDPLNRARAIEQLFGKFQFARISTLFDNVIREGSQASRVLDLAAYSAGELAQISEQELGVTAASAMNQFRSAVEKLNKAMAPVGETFLKIATPIVNFATDVLNSFNNLNEGTKTFIAGLVGLFGVIGPVALMTFGLLANGVANLIKLFLAIRGGFKQTGSSSQILGEQISYMTQEQLEASAVAASLDQAHQNLIQRFTTEARVVDQLTDAYARSIKQQRQFTGPGVQTNLGGAKPKKMKTGGVVMVPGSGKGDKVPAMLEPGEAVIPSAMTEKYSGLIQGMIAGNIPGFQKGVMLGMPRSGKSTSKNRDAAQQIYEMFLNSSYANVPPTNYGHQLSPTSGHSFPIFGLGGVYMGPGGKKVFVKPVMDEKAALAEMRGTQIARQAHGLEAPEQRIVVIKDPQDVTGTRRFLALESDLDAKFVNNEPKALFNEEQYFRQLVASLVRVDKDLAAGNLFGNVVADVGPAGVFDRASGVRDYKTDLPSMEQQAMVNLLGIKGGAKRAFAESTVGLMARMTPQQYHQYMIAEIQRVLPALRQTVAGFGLTNPQEADAYNAMIGRLEKGLTTDWTKFHAIHSAVKPTVPKQSASAKKIPGYADGIVSVPGPKGAGDVMPAMLSPGEAVIPAKKAKKYAPLIQAMISGNIPGFQGGLVGAAAAKYQKEIAAFPELADAIEVVVSEIEASSKNLSQSKVFEELEAQIRPLIKLIKTTVDFNADRGPSGTSNTGVNAAHGNARKILSPEEAQLVGKEMIAAGFTGGTAQALAASTRPVQAFSNLTFPMPRAFNAGDMSGTDGANWINQDPERFTSMIAKNAKIDPNSPGLVEFGNNVAKALENVGATSVSESMFEEIIAQQIEMLAEGAAKKALIEARDTYQTFNVVRTNSSSGQPTREAAQIGTGINAQGQVIEGAEQRSYRASVFRKLLKGFNDDADKFVLQVASDLTASIKNGLGINSPSSEYEAISRSVSEGVRQGDDDAKAAGKSIGKTISLSANTSATSQSGASFFRPPVTQASSQQFVSGSQKVSQVPGPGAAQLSANMPDIMSPLKAYLVTVGANLRQVAADFRQEAGLASSETMGPIKAYFTMVGANIRESLQESKAEFASIFGRSSEISDAGKSALLQFRSGLDASMPQIVIAGDKVSETIALSMAGTSGSIAAIISQDTAEIISKATTDFNSGIRGVSASIEAAKPKFLQVGDMISSQIALGAVNNDRIKALVSGGVARGAGGEALIGPTETVGNAFDVNTRKMQEKNSGAVDQATRSFDNLNRNIMAFSGALTTVNMVASSMGHNLGEFGNVITMASSLMFTLTMIISALNTEKLQELLNTVRKNMKDKGSGLLRGFGDALSEGKLGKFGRGLKSNAGVDKIFAGGIANSAKNLGSVFKQLGPTILKTGSIFARLLPGIGLAITAFTAFKLIADAQKKREQEVEGLGQAANVAGDALKYLAERTNTTLIDLNAGRGGGLQTDGSDTAPGVTVSAQSKSAVEALKADSDEFNKKFESQVTALKAASSETAQGVVASMALDLQNQGFAPDVIAAAIEMLLEEAGKKDVNLSFMEIGVEGKLDEAKLKETSSQLIDAANKAINKKKQTVQFDSIADPETYIGDEARGAAMAVGAATGVELEPLMLQLTEGTITLEEYSAAVDSAMNNLKSLDPVIRSVAIRETAKTFDAEGTTEFSDAVNGLTNESDKLLAVQAKVNGQYEISKGDQNVLNAGGRDAIELRKQITAGIDRETAALAKKNKEEAIAAQAEIDLTNINAEIDANNKLISDIPTITALRGANGEALLTQKEALNLLTDSNWQNAFSEAQLTDQQNGNNAAVTALIAKYKEYMSIKGALNDLDASASAIDNIAKTTEEIEKQNETFDWLIQNGYSVAEAKIIMGNADLYAAAAAAMFAASAAQIEGSLPSVSALEGTAGELTRFGNAAMAAGIKTGAAFLDPAEFEAMVDRYMAATSGFETRMGNVTGGGGSAQEDPYEGILSQLQKVRDASIDITEKLTGINKALGKTNNLKVFSGVQSQLISMGASGNFIDWILGQDEDTQKRFISVRNGVVSLTKAGRAAQRAFSEISIGEAFIGLQQQNQSMADQEVALRKLIEAGYDLSTAYQIVEDAALAAVLASAEISVGTEEWERLTDQIDRATTASEIFAATQRMVQQNIDFSGQQDIFQWILDNEDMLSGELINEILNNADLQQFILAGPELTEEQRSVLTEYLQNFLNSGDLELDVSKLTIEGMEKIFDDGFSKAMEAFAAEEQAIELEYEVKLADDNKLVSDAQNQIAAINFEIDDLDAQLVGIAEQEEKINEKYDDKLKALEDIKSANDDISRQQRSQLTIADALTRGDISAAAAAMQELRSENAQARIDNQQKLLEKSRELELGRLVSQNGKTRKQLEEDIKKLKDEIFLIEEKTLEPAEERIRLANIEKQQRLDAITILGRTKLEWEQIKNGIDLAKTRSDIYKDAMQAALDIVIDIENYWKDLDRTVTTTHNINEIVNRITAGTPPPATTPTPPPTGGGNGAGGGANGGNGGGPSDPPNAGPRPSYAPFGSAGFYPGEIRKTAAGLVYQWDIGAQKWKYLRAEDRGSVGSPPPANSGNLLLRAAGGIVPRYLRMGGMLPYKSEGGSIFKPLGTDTIPAMLSPGEFVVRRSAVENFGVDRLKSINSGTYSGESVYNYSVNVSVKSDANPDQIARAVIGQIKQIDSQRIRGNRF